MSAVGWGTMGKTKPSVKKYLTSQPTKPHYRTTNSNVVVFGVFKVTTVTTDKVSMARKSVHKHSTTH